MRLFVLMVVVTIVEVFLIIRVSALISWFPTLLLIIGTAFLGSYLVKQQWRHVIGKMQSLQSNPTNPMLEALMVIISGVLLITPGFLTDIVGFALLVPRLREYFIKTLGEHFKGSVTTFGTYSNNEFQQQNHSNHDPDVIDGEFERKD